MRNEGIFPFLEAHKLYANVARSKYGRWSNPLHKLGSVAGTLGLILQLMIPREQSTEVEHLDPIEDEEIDEVVDGLMEDEESSEEEIDDSGEEDSDQESQEQDSTEDGDSIEEEEEVPEDEGDVSDDDEAPEAEKKAPVKKKKF